MKVRFTQDYTVADTEGRHFAEGETVDLPEASAEHFLRRNVAEPAGKAGAKTAKEPAAGAEPPEGSGAESSGDSGESEPQSSGGKKGGKKGRKQG